MGLGAERKAEYFTKLINLFSEYSSAMIVSCDNVSSAHMQDIRRSVRNLGATMLMGKNTLIRKAIRQNLENNKSLEALLPYIAGNVGFIFCDRAKLKQVVDVCKSNRVGAAAKPGTIAPKDVIVPAGPTGMEPTMTSFLQALNIATKINKGQIEIIKDVELLKAGQKVGNSEASLLHKLNIRPFDYGLTVEAVFDQQAVFSPDLLDLTDEVVERKFAEGVRNIAALSLALGIPTKASVPHSLMNAYKNVLSFAVATEYTYKQAEALKERIKNPGAFAAAPVAAAPAAAAAGKKEEKKEEKKKEEEKEESDGDMGFGLFD